MITPPFALSSNSQLKIETPLTLNSCTELTLNPNSATEL